LTIIKPGENLRSNINQNPQW